MTRRYLLRALLVAPAVFPRALAGADPPPRFEAIRKIDVHSHILEDVPDRRDFTYYAGDGEMEYGSRTVRCLSLPREVLEKLYHQNAERIIPGLE
jgi:hypothetical protein